MSAGRAGTLRRAKPPGGRDLDPPGFRAVVRAFAGHESVTLPSGGKGFGSRALRWKGKIFALLSRQGRFVIKVPGGRARELVASGKGEFFAPRRGRLMKEWVVILGPSSSWTVLAREALLHARELRPGAASRGGDH